MLWMEADVAIRCSLRQMLVSTSLLVSAFVSRKDVKRWLLTELLQVVHSCRTGMIIGLW